MWKRSRPRIFMLAICSAFPAASPAVADERRPARPNAAVLGGDRAPAAFPMLRRVTVAVVEAGVDGNHPDLAGRIEGAGRFGGGDPLFPTSPHGTAVAGLIAAIDGNGRASTASRRTPDCSLRGRRTTLFRSPTRSGGRPTGMHA